MPARVEQIAVEMTDPEGVERHLSLIGQVTGRLAPRLAVLSRDQKEPPGRDEVLERAALAVLVVDPGVRQRCSWTRRGLVDADVIDRPGRGVVAHDGRRLVAVAVLNVKLAELHRLRAKLAQHGRAVLGILRPAAQHSP